MESSIKKERIANCELRMVNVYCSLFAICYLLFASFLLAASWTKWKCDVYGSNYIRETAKNVDKNSLWEYNTFSQILASPVIKGNYLYICTRSGAVYCFNSLTGEVVWQYSTDGQINSTPIIEDNKIYVASFDGNLYCFNSLTGEILWKYSTVSAETFSSPLIFKNMILYAPGFGNPDYEDYLISLELNGNFKWRFDTGNLIHSSPITDGNYIYITSNNGRIYKIDSLGNGVWYYQTDGSFRMATPFCNNGKIFFAPGDNERRVIALNSDGSVFWMSDSLNLAGEGMVVSSVSGDDRNIYIVYATTKQYISALSQSDGSILWKLEIGDIIDTDYIASPSLSNGRIFVPNYGGYLFEISTSGVILNNFLIDNSSSPVYTTPAISNGYIYLATWNGKVKCFKASEVVSISYPDEDTVSGIVGIKGYIESLSSINWTVYYSTNMIDFVKISTGNWTVSGSTITYWDTSLLTDGTYYLKIEATNGYGISSCILNNPPRPPENLTAFDYPFDNGGAIKLSWTLSPDDGCGSNDVVEYRIYRSTSPVNFYTLHVKLPKGTTYYRDTGVKNNLTYYYYLTSYDGVNESVPSKVVSAYPFDNLPPQEPEGLTVINPGVGGVLELYWSANKEEDIGGYKLYRSTDSKNYSLLVILSSDTVSYQDKGLINFITYYYLLSSFDTSGNQSSPSGPVFEYPSDFPPKTPDGFRVSAGDGFVDIYWQENTEKDIKGYNIYRSTDNKNFSFLTRVLHPGTTHQDLNVINHTTYYYCVKAIDEGGNESSPTEIKSAYPWEGADVVPPAEITSLDSISLNEAEVKLSWTSPGDDGTTGNLTGSFRIDYDTFTKLWNENEYKIEINVSDLSPLTPYSYTITELTPLLTYYFIIYTFDNASRFSSSNISTSVVTGISPDSITDLKAEMGNIDGSILLSWTSPGDDGREGDVKDGGFRIVYSTNSSLIPYYEVFISTEFSPFETHSFLITGLDRGVTYYFKIFAFDEWNLESKESNLATALSQPDSIKPRDVLNFMCFDTPFDYGGSITLTWNLSPDDGSGENDVKYYYIYRSTSTLTPYTLHLTLSKGTTYWIDKNLVDGITYYYLIKSFDGWNYSDGVYSYAVPLKNFKEVSVEGGELELGDGVEIFVSEGTYSEALFFYVRTPLEDEYKDVKIPENVSPLNITKEIILVKESELDSLSGKDISYIRNYVNSREIVLDKNIILKISYKGGSYNNERRLRLFLWDEGDEWKMIHTSYPDIEEDKVVAEINDFSYFRIMEFLGAPYLIDKNKCYVYPQPAKGDELYFKFYLGNECKVKIRVFNLNGDLIWYKKKDYGLIDIGKAQEIKWDISNVASGVYIWILEGEKGNRKDVIKRKMAIVH